MSICWSVVSWPWLLKYYTALFMNHYTVDKVLGKQYYYYMYAIHLIEINFIPNCTGLFSELFRVRFPLLPNYIEHSWSCTLVDGRFQASPWYSPLWQGAVLTKFQPCFPQSLQWLSGESIQTRTWRVVSLILTWSSEFSKLSGVRLLLPKYIACLNLQTVFNSIVLFTIFY